MSLVIQLECYFNNYPWGKTGKEPFPAEYAAATPGTRFQLDENKEYAEMWMGMYPTTPSLILSSGEDLPMHINTNKEKLIGKPILSKFGADVPFFAKMSRIHEKGPDKFGDPNHKSEIAVALGKFESFVGFMPLFDMEELSTSTPDFLPRLAQQYSNSDPGNLVALLTMNYMVLQKGDAIYFPAHGIHAYLSEDIVECMARSENVPNTGFCPRADRDSVDVFISSLTFHPPSAEAAILKPKNSDKELQGNIKILAPPMSEFNILVTDLKAGQSETIKALQGLRILVVTSGHGDLKLEAKNVRSRKDMSFLSDIVPRLSLQRLVVWRLT